MPTTTAATITTMMPLRICLRRFWLWLVGQPGLPGRSLAARFSVGTARDLPVPSRSSDRPPGRTGGRPTLPGRPAGAICSLVRHVAGGPEVRRDLGRRRRADPGRGRSRGPDPPPGNDVVVVVSAMGKTTDELVRLATT